MSGIRVGSTGPIVIAWQTKIRAVAKSYALGANGQPLRIDGTFGNDDAKVAAEWRARSHGFVNREWAVTDAELISLGINIGPVPPAVTPRHKALVFRGTGGIIGEDYVSRVCQGAADLVEEINPPWQAGMGGLPVGLGTTPDDLSMQKAGDAAVENVSREIESSTWSFLLGGYSAGAWVASRIRASLEPGGRLAAHKSRYVAGFAIGNPAHPFGHTYYLGAITSGVGISDFHLPRSCCTWDWCELLQELDMYANVPGGKTGEIMTGAYGMVTHTQLTDMLGTVKAMLPFLLEILADAGIDLPFIGKLGAGLTAGGLAGLLPVLLPILVGMLPGLIGGLGTPNAGLTDQAAAVQAAIIAIRFVIAGTWPHISYHNTLAPGLPMTYVQLGIQHVRHWAGITPVRT